MSTIASTNVKSILNYRRLGIGLIVILAAIVTSGFIWVQTNHVIASPSIQIMDWLWRAFH